jgi:hypothetical protein
LAAQNTKYSDLSKLLTHEINDEMNRELRKQVELALQKTSTKCDDSHCNQQNIINEINRFLRKGMVHLE